MRNIHTFFLAGILCFSVALQQGWAEQPDPPRHPDDNVLRPMERRATWGVLLGGNYTISSGSLLTTCQCEYESGSGFGLAGGAFFELPVGNEFSVIGQIAFDGLGATYSSTETRLEYTDDGDFVFIDFDKETDISLSYINIAEILGKWNIGGRAWYVFAGPSLGLLISSNIHETEEIATPGYAYATTSALTKEYADYSLDELYDVNQFRVALRLGTGYEFRIGKYMTLAPEASYSLPFTTIVKGFKSSVSEGEKDVTDWKHSAIQVSVRLKFDIR